MTTPRRDEPRAGVLSSSAPAPLSPRPSPHRRRRKAASMIQVTLLAIIAGYADTVGYLHLNAFAGLMTGNTIFMGIELATGKYAQAAAHAAMIGTFLVGVILGRIAIRLEAKVWMALTLTSVLLVVC